MKYKFQITVTVEYECTDDAFADCPYTGVKADTPEEHAKCEQEILNDNDEILFAILEGNANRTIEVKHIPK